MFKANNFLFFGTCNALQIFEKHKAQKFDHFQPCQSLKFNSKLRDTLMKDRICAYVNKGQSVWGP